ncbi:EAL domain-containing protein [Candidatus Accumulibacter sp. ACC003]|uniref:EAL domain-containing protein n=1 Tax=Candidatus Accumulibacter sp. ACC003 TaxID=2823334 RepID=UPI0025C55E13|nr:EAL domain-containing protein [Candidatus Accumulibacter sp. ACC003]
MTLPSPELNAIHEGLKAGDFFVEYLPIISLGDQTCLGAEALIRWRRPGGEVIQPGEFIPLLENTPLSGLITYWLVDTVTVEVGGWLHANPEARLSINVPPEILGRGGLEYAAVKSGLSALRSQLILEVTERGIPDQLGLMALNSMHQSGISLALDDVTMSGTNLALISRCDFKIIKIDRLLTDQIQPDCPQPDWLRGLAGLLQTTDLTVVAEGIETNTQVQALSAAGVQLAQGFYFSPPLAAAELMSYYARTRKTPANLA